MNNQSYLTWYSKYWILNFFSPFLTDSGLATDSVKPSNALAPSLEDLMLTIILWTGRIENGSIGFNKVNAWLVLFQKYLIKREKCFVRHTEVELLDDFNFLFRRKHCGVQSRLLSRQKDYEPLANPRQYSRWTGSPSTSVYGTRLEWKTMTHFDHSHIGIP